MIGPCKYAGQGTPCAMNDFVAPLDRCDACKAAVRMLNGGDFEVRDDCSNCRTLQTRLDIAEAELAAGESLLHSIAEDIDRAAEQARQLESDNATMRAALSVYERELSTARAKAEHYRDAYGEEAWGVDASEVPLPWEIR